VSLALLAFEEDSAPATALAAALGLDLQLIELHVFPDGESRPRVSMGSAKAAVIYRTLSRPDPKIMPLLLAADAARRNGAERVVLVAPYMPYLRQDAVFSEGEPISRDVIGRVLGEAFDRIVTVEPHLHRTASLDPVFRPAEVTSLSAADQIASLVRPMRDRLIVGPDRESLPWAAAVAVRLGAEHAAFSKRRRGDREIELSLPADLRLAGRPVTIVDDICSSGATLGRAVQLLLRAGAASVEAVVTHALIGSSQLTELHALGLTALSSTDSCPHPTNRISLAPMLAGALREEVR
jgi:ribose-phosphate pyrophosphokinase